MVLEYKNTTLSLEKEIKKKKRKKVGFHRGPGE